MTLADNGATAAPTLLLDIPEAATCLRCGRSTVYELLKAGEIRAIKIGRRRLVTHESIVEFVRRKAS